MTLTQTITIRDLIAAASRFACGGLPDASSLAADSVGDYAAVLAHTGTKRTLARWVDGYEVVDGMHRSAGLSAWAGDDAERLETLVPVVVTDDAQLVSAILDRKDAGRDDVDDLIEASLK
jgi:hypothetical protein